jgi:hypothetical protein
MLELILLALVTGRPLSAGCAGGCPCIAPPGGSWQSPAAVARAQRDADAIFRGHVIRVDTLERDTSDLGSDTVQAPRLFIRATVIRYTFAVERSWKGPSEQQLVVTNYAVDTSCGRRYKSGISYLVYADNDRQRSKPHGLSTYSCSRVRSGADAEDDLKVIGTGRASTN